MWTKVCNRHDGKNPFSCPICEGSYSDNFNLQRHIRLVQQHIENIHEGKKSFGCTICNVRVSQKGDANRHVEIIHGGKKAFTCSICDYKFSQKGSLNLQIKRQHEICSMEFMKNTELAKHEKKIWNITQHLYTKK